MSEATVLGTAQVFDVDLDRTRRVELRQHESGRYVVVWTALDIHDKVKQRASAGFAFDGAGAYRAFAATVVEFAEYLEALSKADAEPERTPPYELWVIDPNGDDRMVYETRHLEFAHQEKNHLMREVSFGGCRAEVWRDGVRYKEVGEV